MHPQDKWEKEVHPHGKRSKQLRTEIQKLNATSKKPRGKKIAPRNQTTSFLTATTLVYAIGAGITAAAGTRLALQLVLDKFIKLFSFQLHHRNLQRIGIYCHYLPVSGLGNLRACCLPWKW